MMLSNLKKVMFNFVDLSYAVFVYGVRIPKIFFAHATNLIRHGVWRDSIRCQ